MIQDPQTAASASDYAYCSDLVRGEDKDRWLAALFVPAQARHHIHALYAFNIEMSRVSETVSEPLLGEIRLQWWRDILEGKEPGDAKASPVAAALVDTIVQHDLPKAPLIKLIEARLSREVYNDPIDSAAALESYAEATSANLFRLAALMLGGKEAVAAYDAAGNAGIAYAVTGLLRALPWNLARGQIFIPADFLAKHGAAREELIAGQVSPGAYAALDELRTLARAHLAAFAEKLPGVSRKFRPALLPAALCEPYLKQAERPGYHPLKSIVELPQWKRQWYLWRASRRWS